MSDPSEIFLRNLSLIERVILSICRHGGLSPDETEEFAADVKLRLIEHDYAIIRAFKGRSSFATYMGSVIGRMLLDHRNRQWGKWRQSAEAKHLGDVAMKLERLLYRERHTVDEAFAELERTCPGITRHEVEDLAARVPQRARRIYVKLDESLPVAATHEAEVQREDLARRVSKVISALIETLPDEDQHLLRLRFDCEMAVPQIARSLRADTQVLYRRLYAIFQLLREKLERSGIAAADVADLIGKDVEFLDFHLKSRGVRPSEVAGRSTVAGREEEPADDR
jgi:RNA polymerase sigma factor (sigma-70 family)